MPLYQFITDFISRTFSYLLTQNIWKTSVCVHLQKRVPII